jgi:predicted hydrolase (HD superfamily)
MHAVSLMRPTGFNGMKPKSVTKKLKTLNFAANVSRADIQTGADLIQTPLNDHILFLISVFSQS